LEESNTLAKDSNNILESSENPDSYNIISNNKLAKMFSKRIAPNTPKLEHDPKFF